MSYDYNSRGYNTGSSSRETQAPAKVSYKGLYIGLGLLVAFVASVFVDFGGTTWQTGWRDLGKYLAVSALFLVPLVAIIGWGIVKAEAYRSLAAPIALGLAVVVAFGGYITTYGYYLDKNVKLGSVEVTKTPMPEVDERAATYAQASKELGRSVAAVNAGCRGEIGHLAYVPSSAGGYYTAISDGTALRRDTTCVIKWDMKGVSDKNFTVAKLEWSDAITGSLGNSLIRKVRSDRDLVGKSFDDGDIFGDVVNGKARVYLPATSVNAGMHAHRVPAGLAIVSETGSVDFKENVKAGEFEGPVYPLSLLKGVEEATTASGGLFERWNNKVGYSNESSDGNPNGENPGQFVVPTKDGRLVAVTPLVTKKSARAIAAVAVTPMDEINGGSFNTTTIHELDKAMTANSDIADRVKEQLPSPPFPSGLSVREILPVANGVRVADIGTDAKSTFKVVINADNSMCVFSSVSGAKLGCVEDRQPFSVLPGALSAAGGVVEGGAPAAPSAPVPAANAELTKLSDAELKQLRDAVLAEQDRRLAAK